MRPYLGLCGHMTGYVLYRYFSFLFNKRWQYVHNSVMPLAVGNGVTREYTRTAMPLGSYGIPYFSNPLRATHGLPYFGMRAVASLAGILLLDSILIDDEPILEPLEWSLWQSWLLFIFGFAWVAENLITSRFGSYTGRDKRVWCSWYKTFWLVDGYFIICIGVAALFVIVPFYYELTYHLSFVYQWWHCYSRIFFVLQFWFATCTLWLILLVQLSMLWITWRRLFIALSVIGLFLAYFLFFQIYVALFAYFTDTTWYQQSRAVNYIQLSHEPARWGWGGARRDHFTYHRTATVFWYKTDNAFAGALLFLSLMQAWTLFFVFLYWIILLRAVWATKEVSYTYLTYAIAAVRQYFYLLGLFIILIVFSYLVGFWRLPPEMGWDALGYNDSRIGVRCATYYQLFFL